MDGLGRRGTQTAPRASDLLVPEKSGAKGTWSLDSGVKDWTDEKHSLFLKSMEASFVDHLYSYVDTPAWNSLKRNDVTSSRRMHCAPSGQKLNFERLDFELNKTHKQNSPGLSANPRIRHFQSECKSKALAPANPPEVSDQNFTDEEIKGEKASTVSSSKMKKKEKPDGSSCDQVVPHAQNKCRMAETRPEKCVFQAR